MGKVLKDSVVTATKRTTKALKMKSTSRISEVMPTTTQPRQAESVDRDKVATVGERLVKLRELAKKIW